MYFVSKPNQDQQSEQNLAKTSENIISSTTTPLTFEPFNSSTSTTTVEISQPENASESPVQPTPEPIPQSQPTSNWWDYPANIMQTTRSGDDLLVLVNKQYQLPSGYEPSDIVELTTDNTGITTGGLYARAIILPELKKLSQDIAATGIDLRLASAYRSFDNQVGTYNYWVGYLGNSNEADKVSARAGHSQHQLGTTLDFSTYQGGVQLLWGDFTGSAAQIWLNDNAWKYGFVQSYPNGLESVTGYSAESWHFRYIGVENAAAQKSSGLSLEEWLRQQN
jgi:D-alanyl-D-alanine carboxypeptidase